jgi:putative ABC transport system substrate-binding protein
LIASLITLLGGAAAWPIVGRAQQRPGVPVVGWLGVETREAEDFRVLPFRQALKEAGYIEGQNLAIELKSRRFITRSPRRRAAGSFEA